MAEAVDTENGQDEPEFAWRLVRLKDNPAARLELGKVYADVPDAVLTVLMHQIGESLIKAGTQLLQSQVGDDEDEDGWDDE